MAEPTAEPICQTIELRLTGQPTVNYRWGSGAIRPDRVILTYLDDRRLAHLYGSWIREDGEQTDDRVDQLYRHDDAWPDWLTVLARKHAPAAPVSPPADRAAVLREAADHLTREGRAREDATWSDREAELARGWQDAAHELRRMADEAQQADTEQNTQPLTPCTCRQTIHAQEHKGRTVPDCPWCMPDPDIRPNRPTPGQAVNVVTLPDHTVDEEI